MTSNVHLSPKISRVELIGHIDLLVIFFILIKIIRIPCRKQVDGLYYLQFESNMEEL
jgi:hypothetical protein